MLELLVELARSCTGAVSAELTLLGDPGVLLTKGAQPMELGQSWADRTGIFSDSETEQLSDCQDWVSSVAILPITGPTGEVGWIAAGSTSRSALTPKSITSLKPVQILIEDQLDRTIEQIRLNEIGDLLRDSQQQLVATGTQLAASNAELEQFAYIAAHELVAPLRAVSVYAELLEGLIGSGDSPDTAQASLCAAQIRTGIITMSQQVRYLMDLSTIQPGTDSAVPTDLNAVLDSALSTLADPLEAVGASVEATPLPIVSGRHTPLQSVFANLISNAIRYRDPDRQLLISVDATDSANTVRISVRDNGVGVDPSDKKRIFNLFERASASAAGSGIGLAVSRRIVESFGGSIGVDASEAQGSVFWVEFPRIGTTHTTTAQNRQRQASES